MSRRPSRIKMNRKKHLPLAKDFLNIFFRGRNDVFSTWYERKDGGSGYGFSCQNKFNDKHCPYSRNYQGNERGCRDCSNRKYKPIGIEDAFKHFEGNNPLGVYPLVPEVAVSGEDGKQTLLQNATYFVAFDFDDHNDEGQKDPLKDAGRDVLRLHETLEALEIPHLIESSKSAKGFHVWIFFKDPIAAFKVRRVFQAVLEEAQLAGEDYQQHSSYDRMFPHQDSLSGPDDLGNLILVPLSGRFTKQGGSKFVNPDDSLKAFDRKSQVDMVHALAAQIKNGGEMLCEESRLDELAAEWKIDLTKKHSHPAHTQATGLPPGIDPSTLPIEDYGIRPDGELLQGLEHVVKNCSFIRWCGEKASSVTEPLWKDMISNLCRFECGDKLIHEYSSNDAARYNAADTDKKIEHLKGSSGPITCKQIMADGSTICPKAGCGEHIIAPISFARHELTAPKKAGELLEAIPKDGDLAEKTTALSRFYNQLANMLEGERRVYYDELRKRHGIPVGDSKKSIQTLIRRKQKKNNDKPAIRDVFNGQIFEDAYEHLYYLDGEHQNEDGEVERRVISSFIVKPKQRIWLAKGGEFDQSDEIIIADLQTRKGRIFEDRHFARTAFTSKQNFIRSLPSYDCQWSGNDNNIQGLLRVISEIKIPELRGTTVLGYLRDGNKDLWALQDGILSEKGKVEDTDIIFVDDHNPLPRKVRYDYLPDADSKKLALQVYDLLPKVNELSVVLPVIGWFFATVMKARFRRQRIVDRFPLLFLWGTQGSAKTSLLSNIFWPLFGIDGAEPFSATQTDFSFLRLLSATNGIPVFIDEFKPYDMPKFRLDSVLRLMRRIYSGEEETRGNANKSITSYHLQAPLVMAGETRPNVPAILERILSVNPNKNTIKDHPEFTAAYHKLRSIRLNGFAPAFISWSLSIDPVKIWSEAQQRATQAVDAVKASRDVPVRLVENLSLMMVGLILYEEYGAHIGLTKDKLGFDDDDIQDAVAVMLDDLLEGESGVKSGLDQFMETLSVLARTKQIKEGVHYAYRDTAPDKLYIHFRSCHAAFLEHIRRTGSDGEVLDHNAIRRQMRESTQRGGYVTDMGKIIKSYGRSARMIELDLDALCDSLDFDSFPKYETPPQGGNPFNPDDYERDDESDFLHQEDNDEPPF